MSVAIKHDACPCCGGDPERPMFYCGSGGCYVEYRRCPFCGGAGEIARDRRLWPAIGARLRAARLGHLVRIGDENGRWVFTLDESVPEQSMPIYAQAHRWRMPERAVEQIEAGNMDPWSVARQISSMSWPLIEEPAGPHCSTCRCETTVEADS